MKKLVINTALILAVSAGIMSCKSSKDAASLDTLNSGTWELVKINGKDVQMSDYGKGIPTATFNKEEGKIYGNGGCNRYNGAYTLSEDGTIKIGPVMSTKMACLNGSNGETAYHQALDEVNKVKISKNKVLLLKGDTEVLEYKPSIVKE